MNKFILNYLVLVFVLTTVLLIFPVFTNLAFHSVYAQDVSSSDADISALVKNVSISPSAKYLKKGKAQRFRIKLKGLGSLRTEDKAEVQRIKRDFLWSVNGVEGGNDKFGNISKRGIYRAPKKISGNNAVIISAESSELGFTARNATVTLLKKKVRKGRLYVKARWITNESKRIAAGGIPSEVKKVRGILKDGNTVIEEKIVDVNSRQIEFSAVPVGVGYTVILEGIDESGTVIYKGEINNVEPTRPGETPKPVTIVLEIVGGEVSISSISPAITEISAGKKQKFEAGLSGAFDPTGDAIKWSVAGSGSVGTINQNGWYSAPSSVFLPVTTTIRASWRLDENKFKELSFKVLPNVSVTVSPVSAVVSSAGTQQFTATISGAQDTTAAWSVSGVGSVDSSGLYTAPTVLTQTISVVKAVSNQDNTKSATSTITIKTASVSVSPSSAVIGSAGTQQFTASITGHSDTSVTWSVLSGSGTVDSSGLYTAPAVLTQTIETVKAVSNGDSTKSDTGTVTINPVVSVSVSPTVTSVYSTGTKQFTATVTGGQDSTVAWSVVSGGGAINSSGLYTAPSVLAQTSVTIKAESNQDNTKYATASITVNPLVEISISPTSASVASAGVVTFTATVTGALDTTVAWSVDGGSLNGTITGGGVYNAPSVVTTTVATVRVTSVADSSEDATAEVTIASVVEGMKIYPAISHVEIDRTQKYAVVITGTADKSAVWFVNDTEGGDSTYGTISQSGVYTAPAVLPSPVTVTIKAVSNADSSFISTAAVVLKDKGLFWAKSYAGSSTDKANDISVTTDGGFIVAGDTLSFGSGGNDVWLLKLDTEGQVVWQKTYGGAQHDYANAVAQTSDGGYIVAGYTYSAGAGGSDWVILKLDADGNFEWQKTYGGAYYDSANSVKQTSDGGYIIAGSVYAAEYKDDIALLKLDSSGNIQWSKRYGDGGVGRESGYAVKETTDGGYIISGDAWNKALMMKVDSVGTIEWRKEFSAYKFFSVEQTSDGGYVAVGGNPGSNSYGFMVKLYSDGTVAWQKEYGIGSSSGENFYSVEEITGGGFIVSGFSDESDIDWKHLWVLKLDSIGDIIWQKVYYVDSHYDMSAKGAVEIPGEGYAITGFLIDDKEICVLKLDPNGNTGSACGVIHSTTVTPTYSSYTTTSTLGGYTFLGSLLDSTLSITLPSYTLASQCSAYDNIAPAISSTIPAESSSNVNINTVIAIKFSEPVDPSTVNSSNITLYDEGGSIPGTVTYDAEQMTAYFTPNSPLVYSNYYYVSLFPDIADLAGNLTSAYNFSFNTGAAPAPTGWARVFGGANDESLDCVQQTSDGGYIIAGRESSSTGSYRPWIVKFYDSGTAMWGNSYGTESGRIRCIEETSDGGFIAGGEMSSTSGAGNLDFFVMKISYFGGVTWSNLYGNTGVDVLSDIHQTTDGGYIVAGHTLDQGAGGSDIWVIKLDSAGAIQWQKTFGGTYVDFSAYVIETAGGYIVGAETSSYGSAVGITPDALILKLDSAGGILSQNTYGLFGWNRVNSIKKTSDGGYVAAGYYGGPSIIKFNSSDAIEWQKRYENGGYEEITSIVQTSDGGYAVTGRAGFADIFIMKLYSNGTIDWQKTYGGAKIENGYFITQTSDGGYAVAGNTFSFGFGGYDGFFLKTDAKGNIGGTCSIEGEGNIIGTGSATVADTTFTAAPVSVSTSNTSVSPINYPITNASSYTSDYSYCSVLGSIPLSVYLMSSGNAATDSAISSALAVRGHTVTIGVEAWAWDGTQATLSDYDVVVMANSSNLGSGSMSAEGAHELRKYVYNGGGLVTGEWTIRNIDLEGRHRELDPVVPADATSCNVSGELGLYTINHLDAIVNNGMPYSFSFAFNNISGTETVLDAKSGAIPYYLSSTASGTGLTGWNFGAGRVLSFSTLITDVELADDNYSQLFTNAVERAGRKSSWGSPPAA